MDLGSYPRRSIFVGTTNSRLLFESDGGNRRFWVIPDVGRIDLTVVEQICNPLWAQADHDVKLGAAWWLDEADETAHAEQIQTHVFEEVGVGAVATFLKGKSETSIDDVMTGVEFIRSSAYRAGQPGIVRMLRTLGFEERRQRQDGKRRRTWIRVEPAAKEPIFSNVLRFTTSKTEATGGAA